jgi:hypothetical protein
MPELPSYARELILSAIDGLQELAKAAQLMDSREDNVI